MLQRIIIGVFIFVSLTTIVKGAESEPVHFAYANYLGSGIYRTTDQNASLISLPFSYDLGEKDKLSYGLRLPVSVGFFDFSFADIPEFDLPDEVGTITFTPGVAFSYQYTEDWVIESYIDMGYGRNLTTNRGVTIFSAGVSALYSFDINEYDSIWASRTYYAQYDGKGYDAKDSYAAMQFGLDTGLPLKYSVLGYQFQPRLFATVFWYLSEVNFFTPRASVASYEEEQHVNLTNSAEFGITMKFDKTIGYSWAGIDRLGLSYRFTKNFSALRLLFSLPI